MPHSIEHRTLWHRLLPREVTALAALLALVSPWSVGAGAPPPRIAAEQIVVLHAPPGLPRRRPSETRQRAQEALRKVRSGAMPFDAALREYSDTAAPGPRGGYVGIFDATALTFEGARFREALFSLEVGAVSDLLETREGFHIFRRIPVREWAGSHILVQFSGCRNAPVELRRSREEAAERIKKLLGEARGAKLDFADLARRHSEAPNAQKGGALGIFGPYQILPALEHGIAALPVGAVGGPVETPLGFHIFKRNKVERCHVAQILVRYQGAAFDEGVSRSKDAARSRAATIAKRARKAGADFGALAKEFSEDGTGASGGVLRPFGYGELDRAFEETAFGLQVGEISEPVETRHGFHVLLRLKDT